MSEGSFTGEMPLLTESRSEFTGSGTASIGLASSKLVELVTWSKRSKIIWLKQESKQ